MKRALPLLVFLVLLGAAPALAQPAELPADARFDSLVSFSTGSSGESLGVMITALARAVGLTPIIDDVPIRTIVYDIGDPKPFRQVWNLILTLNDLDYLLQDNSIVVVGSVASLARLRAPPEPEPVAAPEPEPEPEPEEPADPVVQRFYRVNNDLDGMVTVLRLVVPGASIAALPGTGALVALATEEQQAQIASTLEEFDVIQAVAAPEPEPEPEPEEPADPLVQRFYRVSNDVDQIVTVLLLAVPGASVEALPGTGALVAVATEDQQAQIVSTLEAFDVSQPVVMLVQRTYFLSHATATALAETLRRTGVIGSDDEAEDGNVLLTDFTVVAESRTNSLIVTGTAGVQERLGVLIAQLDGPQPQVNVQVRIQEISRRSAIDLGINWSTGLGNFTANILAGGLAFIFDTTQVISSLNVLAVLDALETQGLSRRVDDTNLTVLNNGTGTLQSGGTIYISLPGGAENIEREIDYGVEVTVTPRITADGRVTLTISGEVKDVLSTTNDPTFLNLSNRKLTSTVTVEEGQTLLLGGLLQNSLTVSRQRLPIIGSIPIIGPLLGSRTVTEEDNTDLLIIVNATIID